MARQLSTSLSDLCLAVSAFYVAYYWNIHGQSKAAIGIGIQGVAASVGIIRFAMVHPEGTVVYKVHKLFSWLAGAVGVPLIALAFCEKHSTSALGNKIMMFVLCVVVVSIFLPPKKRELCSQAVSGFSLLSVTLMSFAYSNMYGVGACVSYIVAGLVFGGDGELIGLPHVDYLHYALIVGNTLFKLAL